MFDYIIKLFTQPSYQYSILDTLVLFIVCIVGLALLYTVLYVLWLTYRTIKIWVKRSIQKRKLKKQEKQDKGESK